MSERTAAILMSVALFFAGVGVGLALAVLPRRRRASALPDVERLRPALGG